MKNLKRVLAMLLVAVLLFSFAGCHKKDEIAVTVGDVKFTSAYYMCALMSADGEAKTKVDEKLAEKEDSDSTSTEEVDYYSQKIDGKKYEEWVEERATEITLSASYKDSLLQSQKLKKLELSSATKLQAYTKDQKMITEKLSVTLSKDLRYYANIDDKTIVSSEQITKEYISKYLIPHGVEYTYDETSRRYIVNITKELTPEVAPEVYCTLFGRTKVAVNGTTYTVSK